MTTVAEIVEAVKHLPVQEQQQLLVQLGPIFGKPVVLSDGTVSTSVSSDFTRRLMEHFHRAKQTVLGERR